MRYTNLRFTYLLTYLLTVCAALQQEGNTSKHNKEVLPIQY